MNPNRIFPFIASSNSLAVSVLSLFAFVSSLPAATGGPDSYGYTWSDSSSSTSYQWIDLTSTGTVVLSSGNDTASTDPIFGIGSAVELGFPVTLYGTTYTHLVPTSNGYLSTNPAEDGLDATNDCPIPAIPDKGSGARLYVFHDDLDLSGPISRVYYQYFDISPHPFRDCGVSVFSWVNARLGGGSALVLSFQVLLFNDGTILFQYATSGINFGDSATIGIQNATATDGLLYACDTAASITNLRRIRWLPPSVQVNTNEDQFDTPSGAQISFREALRDVAPGGRITFSAATFDPYRVVGSGNQTISKPVAIIGPSDTNSEGFEPIGTRFSIDGVAVHMENLTIRNAPGDALAVGNGGALSLCGVTVQSSVGSALRIEDPGMAHVVDSFFHLPQAGTSPMIEIDGDSSLRLTGSAIMESVAEALVFQGVKTPSRTPNLFISSTSFVCNEHDVIVGEFLDAEIENSTFSGNAGTAIILTDSSLGLRYNTIFENGAGLDLSGSTATASRNVIANNATAGGSSSNLTSGTAAQISSDGYNLSNDGGAPWTGTGDIVNDPELAPLGLYDGPLHFCHLPLSGSPVIEAGGFAPAGAPVNDQRGRPRSMDGDNDAIARTDIGAVEVPSHIIVNTLVDEDDDPAGVNISLREATRDASKTTGRIVFDPSLDGGTITLGSSITELTNVELIDASMLPSGITISGGGSLNEPLFLTGNGLFGGYAFHGVTFSGSRWSAIRYGSAQPLTLTNCRITGNTTQGSPSVFEYDDYGGGLFVSGRAFLNGCRIHNNNSNTFASQTGGGLAVYRINLLNALENTAATAYLYNTSIDDNSGGGLYTNDPLKVVLKNSTLLENSDGGAFLVMERYSLFSMLRSSVIDNTSTGSSGAGMLIARFQSASISNDDPIRIRYSTFHGNTANALPTPNTGGAALIVTSGIVDMEHCVVTNNAGPNAGGLGIFSSGGLNDAGMTIRNSVVVNNYTLDSSGFSPVYIPEEVDEAIPGTIVSLGDNFVGPSAAGVFSMASDVIGTDPGLSPLGMHGGRTLTRHPLAGSPLIDAGTSSVPHPLDQRGFDSRVNGFSDIGSVEAQPPLIVTTIQDEFNTPSGGQLSLREAIRDAGDFDRILFSEAALGGFRLIDLSSAALGQNTQIQFRKPLIIDASDLPGGIIVKGPGSSARVMNLQDGPNFVHMHGVSFTGGNANLGGGAIRKGNNVGFTLTRSAIYQNQANGAGGGILAIGGSLTLENVTVSTNSSGSTGGAIAATGDARVDIRHSTIVDNESSSGAAGIDMDDTSQLSLFLSIVGQNLNDPTTALENFDLEAGTTRRSFGYNLIDDGAKPGWFVGSDQATNLLISGLADTGGQARVHPPLPLSPMVDLSPLSVSIVATTDARGLPRLYGGRVDAGAMEMGDNGIDTDLDGLTDEWEVYYGFNPNDDTDAGGDSDGDGKSALEEHQSQTLPNSISSVLAVRSFELTVDEKFGNPNGIQLGWGSVPGVLYNIRRSIDLGDSFPWQTVGQVYGAAGTDVTEVILVDPTLLQGPRNFFDVQPAP